MIALADLHIGRLTLRGSATAIAHARATLPPALARARWPDEEAILVVRRIAVGGTGTELPARAAALAGQLAGRAVDPWTPAADGAEVVRFRDARDYRACLVRDLLAGTAARRWLWRHRAALLAHPTATALAELLGEDALALPALLEHPPLRACLPTLWCRLDAAAARSLLRAIGAATGWHGAISDALASRAAEAAGSGADLMTEAQTHHERISGDEICPGPEPGPSPPPTGPAATRAGSPRRPAPPGAAAHGTLPASDPLVVLEALLTLWRCTPAALAGPQGGEVLRGAAAALAELGGGQDAESATARASGPGRARAAGGDLPDARRRHDAGAGSIPAGSPASRGFAPPASIRVGAPPRAIAAINARPAAPLRAGAPSEVTDPFAATVTATQAEVDFHTGRGGLFFLLNVLNHPGLRAWRGTLHEPHAGWRELVRLALRLELAPDAPLTGFLAEACALEGEQDPVAKLAGLAKLPARADPVAVDRAVLRHVGDAALRALRAERPARVRASPSHVDVHLRLAEVDLELRRGGLDLDPGWLPWLGRVVRFHYDRSDAADRGGSSP